MKSRSGDADDTAGLDAVGPQSEGRQRMIRLESELADILACTFSEMTAEQKKDVLVYGQEAA
jgi:hypothetical protein